MLLFVYVSECVRVCVCVGGFVFRRLLESYGRYGATVIVSLMRNLSMCELVTRICHLA